MKTTKIEPENAVPVKRRRFIKLALTIVFSVLGIFLFRKQKAVSPREDLPLEAADLYGPHNLAG